MKRWTIRICVFLLLGVIVNIAVAWGCAINANAEWEPVRLPGDISNWDLSVAEESGTDHLIWTPISAPLDTTLEAELDNSGSCSIPALSANREFVPPRWTSIDWSSGAQSDRWITEHASGWPCRSLLYRVDIYADGVQFGGYALDRPQGPTAVLAAVQQDYRALPLTPILPGFVINTVFYAAVLWLMFALVKTPFALRRRRRIKRGLCPKCAYDLRGHAGPADAAACPECGAPR